jgi:hypothetical protein
MPAAFNSLMVLSRDRESPVSLPKQFPDLLTPTAAAIKPACRADARGHQPPDHPAMRNPVFFSIAVL